MSHSPLEEKAGVSKLETIDTGLYDPDAGLSDEERARIVIPSPSVTNQRGTSTNQVPSPGQSPRTKIGLQTHPMGQ